MTIISIIIGKKGSDINETYLLSASYYLFEYFFFQKKSVIEICNFIARNSFNEIDNNKLEYFNYKNLYCLSITKNNLCICAILDNKEYPIRVLRRLLFKTLIDYIELFGENIEYFNQDFDEKYKLPRLFERLHNFQDPLKSDKIYNIQSSLDDTKQIILKNIDKVLERGNSIDELVKKSQDLSNTSRKFYKTSKKLNRCCTIL